MTGKKVYAGGLRIGTRCETVDEFIEKFHRFCEGSLIFIPQAKRPIGRDTAFSFDLKDGRAALCGVGVVLEQFTDSENRFGRPGIVIEVRQLQAGSRPVIEQMSTMQRTMPRRSTQARPTTPPPTSELTPLSPRTLTPIPSYRPRAVTAAIEIDSAIAIASAAAKSGGLPKRTLTNLPVTVPKTIPSPRSAPVQHQAVNAPRPAPSRTPQLAEASGVLPEHAAPRLAEASSSRHETPDVPLRHDLSSLSQRAVPPAIVDEAKSDVSTGVVVPLDAIDEIEDPARRRLEEALGAAAALPSTVELPPLDPIASAARPSIVERPPLDRGAMAPSPSTVEPPLSRDTRAELGGSARSLAQEARTKSRHLVHALIRRWHALSPRRRWVIASGVGATVVALTVVLVMIVSTSPSRQPVPSTQITAIVTSHATAAAQPTVKPEPAKKPTAKKKRAVTKKRVASKPATKPASKKPAAKKAAVKPAVVKKPVPKPTPKPRATR